MSEQSGAEWEDKTVKRGEGGKFQKGTKGGPGRKRVRPLRDVVPFEVEADLWRAHLELAEGDASAREFILRHIGGTPHQACPDLPPIAWPTIMSVDDLPAALGAVLAAQGSGDLDGAALKFLVGLLVDIAKVFEVADLGPKLRKLEEHIASMGGG